MRLKITRLALFRNYVHTRANIRRPNVLVARDKKKPGKFNDRDDKNGLGSLEITLAQVVPHDGVKDGFLWEMIVCVWVGVRARTRKMENKYNKQRRKRWTMLPSSVANLYVHDGASR